jgi:hypothetical protein
VVKQKWVEFEDTNIVAYLHYKGHDFAPYKKGRDRVAFRVFGEDIEEDLSDMYSDTVIQNFLKCLKAVRSSMFTMKSITHEEKEMEDTI